MTLNLEELRRAVEYGKNKGLLTVGDAPTMKPGETVQAFKARTAPAVRTALCPECNQQVPIRSIGVAAIFTWHQQSEFPMSKKCLNSGKIV